MNKLFTLIRESNTARFLIPLGIGLIIFGIIMFVINSQNQDYIKITSTVSNVELAQEEYIDSDGNPVSATYNVNVKYTVNGKEYEAVLDNVSNYNIGDEITIYYNPEDPNQITQTKSLIFPIILIIGGLAAFIGGIISGINALKRFKNTAE